MQRYLIHPIKKSIVRVIDYYPRHCLICKRKTQNRYLICAQCIETLPFIRQACKVCRAKLESSRLLCGQCLTQSYAFDQVIVPFRYEQPIKKLLLQLKFYERLTSIDFFTYFLIEAIKQFNTKLPQLLIPVPLHKKRLRKRGYNQAIELAKPLSTTLSIRMDRYHCRRIKLTQPQQALHMNDRKKNVKNAFRFCKKLVYTHVAIVDDVMTTGATAHEMAKCLKKNGAKTVQVWCCART